jgi:hypothetical protein
LAWPINGSTAEGRFIALDRLGHAPFLASNEPPKFAFFRGIVA